MEESLRSRREALGLTAIDVAARAGCTVETVLRAEFGVHLPHDRMLLARLAGIYGMAGETYVRLALDAAERGVPRRRYAPAFGFSS